MTVDRRIVEQTQNQIIRPIGGRARGGRGIIFPVEGQLTPERVPDDLKAVDDHVELAGFVGPRRGIRRAPPLGVILNEWLRDRESLRAEGRPPSGGGAPA